MKIDQNTKISSLIKENPEVINAISSINKHFEKLKNPILRKILASRVTISDASRIGGISIQQFFDKLQPLGFYAEISGEIKPNEEAVCPLHLTDPGKSIIIDVREDIEKGNDPFRRIMKNIEDLPEDYILKIVNSFEPTPLIKILQKKGYEISVLQESPTEVITYVKKQENTNEIKAVPIPVNSETDALKMESIIKSYGHKVINIDVRNLEMPLPMMQILRETETLPDNYLLYVIHSKIPVYLLPQLESKGLNYHYNKISDDKTILLIYK